MDESPTSTVIFRETLIDDGFGAMIPDPTGEPTEHPVRLRIAHDTKQVADIRSVNEQTFTTNLNRIATWEWDTDIYEGDTFEALGIIFTVGPVDELMKFGGIVGHQAPLKEAEAIQEADT